MGVSKVWCSVFGLVLLAGNERREKLEPTNNGVYNIYIYLSLSLSLSLSMYMCVYVRMYVCT